MAQVTQQKIVISGAQGLLGWHSAARLHAKNCAARYRGETEPYVLKCLDRAVFNNADALAAAVDGADAVLHFAGVNRGSDAEVAEGNSAIADALAKAMLSANSQAHIVYANSTHAFNDTVYGRSKRLAGERLAAIGTGYTNLILPHIFGETARPYYNNVTATLIDQIWAGTNPVINPDGSVSLLHAGAAAEIAIAAGLERLAGELRPEARPMTIEALYKKLSGFHADYSANIFPELTDPFDLALFNCYRSGSFPRHYPYSLKANFDTRGMLFETSRSMGGSQTFVSSTLPGQVRGDHFHIDLVERFVVVAGRAVISIRKVLTDEIYRFEVSGDRPVAIDMPPLHTHNIINHSDSPVITYFWSHRLFDPANPDTFADPVD